MSFLGSLVKTVLPVAAAAIPGIGPVASAALGAAGSFASNSITNSANAKAAADANAFTETQLKNRHQWEVADLRKAGLNPILSAGGTPSIGGSAKADVESSGEAITRGINSALAVKTVEAQLDNIRADTDKKRWDTTLTKSLDAKTNQEAINAAWQEQILRADLSTAKATAAAEVARQGVLADWYRGRTGRLSTALDKLNPLKNFIS